MKRSRNDKDEKFYLKSIELENIKCFSRKTKLRFYKSDNSNKISQWNLILGDNGSGKTTILKCIYLSLADDFYLGKSEEFHKYRRNGDKPSVIKTEVCSSFNTNDIVPSDSGRNHRRASFSEEFNIIIEGATLRTKKARVPIFAYGATRKMASGSKHQNSRTDYGANLFDEDSSLMSAEEWILEADHIDRLRNVNFNSQRVNEILLKLFKGIISEIRVSENTNIPKAEFKTKYGWVELNQLSLGYRTIIAWLVDFTYKLSEYYPDSENIYQEAAIVLVDEIDLHLHVTFQKKLVKFLTSNFKNVQFIVSAHSPLVVQASSSANILLLQRTGTQAKVAHNNQDIGKWRIDQIYASELFGNVDPRSDSISKLIKKKSDLLLKDDLSERERNTLEKINLELDNIPSGKTMV